jgi:hypothetical protein
MIEEALGGSAGRPGKVEDAADFLRAELAEGPLPSKEVFERGRREGFSERTLNRAKVAAGVQPTKTGPDAGWVWQLKRDGR